MMTELWTWITLEFTQIAKWGVAHGVNWPLMVNWWAGIAALLASVFLGLRANLLKPSVVEWQQAPTRVWLAISGLSIAELVSFAVIMFDGAKVAQREAALHTVLAIAAYVLWVNLARKVVHTNRMLQQAAVVT